MTKQKKSKLGFGTKELSKRTSGIRWLARMNLKEEDMFFFYCVTADDRFSALVEAKKAAKAYGWELQNLYAYEQVHGSSSRKERKI